MQVPELKALLLREEKVHLSSSMITRFLNRELNVSYRKLRPVRILYNGVEARLQR